MIAVCLRRDIYLTFQKKEKRRTKKKQHRNEIEIMTKADTNIFLLE
jgi:hypothetical protein